MAFSFGQAPSTNATGTTGAASVSLGGTSQQSKPNAGFSFGAANNTGQQSQSTSLFGNSSAQQQPAQSSSIFGAQQSAPSNLFGAQQQNPQGSLFGPQSQQQPSQPQQTGLGAKPLFGTQSAAAPSQAQNNPLTLSQLGGSAPYNQQQSQQQIGKASTSTTALFGNASANTAINSHDKRLGIPVNDKVEAIRAAWDLHSIQSCQFLYYFYNAIPANPPGLGEAALGNPNFGRRQDATGPRHDALWLQTLRENPDRSKLVPVLAVGFQDLKMRRDAQMGETGRQSAKLMELQKRLDDLTSKHSLSNSVRISTISRKQTSIHHRLIGIAKRIHLLIPAIRGHSITLKEEQLKSLLHACEMELESISMNAGGVGASGSGTASMHHRLRGRINELWAQIGSTKAKREAMGNNGNLLEWAVVDDGAINDVVKILTSQQQGLDHLSITLKNDTRALDIIVKGLEGVELVGAK